MNAETGANLAVLSAFFVMFSALWDPRISAVLAVLFCAAPLFFRFLKKTHASR